MPGALGRRRSKVAYYCWWLLPGQAAFGHTAYNAHRTPCCRRPCTRPCPPRAASAGGDVRFAPARPRAADAAHPPAERASAQGGGRQRAAATADAARRSQASWLRGRALPLRRRCSTCCWAYVNAWRFAHFACYQAQVTCLLSGTPPEQPCPSLLCSARAGTLTPPSAPPRALWWPRSMTFGPPSPPMMP